MKKKLIVSIVLIGVVIGGVSIVNHKKKSNTVVHLKDWQIAYRDFFASYSEENDDYFNRDSASYRFEDLNNDGISEMIVFPGSADFRENVYAYYDSDVVEVFRTSSAVHDTIDPLPNTEYFLDSANSGNAYYTDVLRLENGDVRPVYQMACANAPEYQIGETDYPEYKYYHMDKMVDEAEFFKLIEDEFGIKANSTTFQNEMLQLAWQE